MSASQSLLFSSKLINKSVPNTVDLRALTVVSPSSRPSLRAEADQENMTLVIESARAIGCQITDSTADNILQKDPQTIRDFLVDLIRVNDSELMLHTPVAHSHSHTLSHTLTLTHSLTHTLIHSTLTHSLTLTHSHTHTLFLSHTLTHFLSHTHTLTHSLSLSHTHTLTLSLSLSLSHTHTGSCGAHAWYGRGAGQYLCESLFPLFQAQHLPGR